MRKLIKLLCMSFIILLLSGCSLVYINKQSMDDIISILGNDTKLKSISIEGYSYYLPQGVNLKESRALNSVLYYNSSKMYLYVDLVSYYHKIENTYKVSNSSFYSKKIDINGKSGYLEINELEDKYFIAFMYNYSKIEGYVKKDDLNKTLTQMAYILNSIKFNDAVLASLIGEDKINYNGETFNIFKANGNEGTNYLDVIDQYDTNRKNSKDEDVLELNENIE